MHKKGLKYGALALAGLLIAGLAGCAPINRQAADSDEPLGLFAKGVRVCVSNDTQMPVRVAWLKTDTHDDLPQGTVQPGKTTCGEGTSALSYDVGLEIKWRDNRHQDIFFANGWYGYPEATVDPSLKTAADACGLSGIKGPNGVTLGFAFDCTDAFKENETRYYPVGNKSAKTTYAHLSEVTRNVDSDWKEFHLSVIQ